MQKGQVSHSRGEADVIGDGMLKVFLYTGTCV